MKTIKAWSCILFYLAVAYFLAFSQFEIGDYLSVFEVKNNFDRINELCLAFFRFGLVFFTASCLAVAILIFTDWLKKSLNKGDF